MYPYVRLVSVRAPLPIYAALPARVRFVPVRVAWTLRASKRFSIRAIPSWRKKREGEREARGPKPEERALVVNPINNEPH